MSTLLQKPLNIVAVSGGLNTPSKTEALVQEILNELGDATPINVHFIKFSEIGHLLGGAIYRNQLPQRVQDDLAAVEAADALIVGTPVYRASFTGLFNTFSTLLSKRRWSMYRYCLQLQVAVNAMRWYWGINFAHYSVSSKHKLYRLGSMPQTKTLPQRIPSTVNYYEIALLLP